MLNSEIMGNNNVTGQQVSEEPAHDVDKIIVPSNGSPGLNNNTNCEKTMADNKTEVTQDEQVTSDQNHPSSKIGVADAKNRGLIQGNTSTQDDQGGNLSNEDHELVKDVETETTINSTELITPVSATIEDMISVEYNLVLSEKIKQPEHGTRDRVGESTTVNSSSLFSENLEESPEDGGEPRSHEHALVGGNMAGKDSTDIVKKGHIVVSTEEDGLISMQGEITSSTESIVSTYHDADDSEIKEVVIEEGKPGQNDKPSYVQPLDATNIETSKGYTTEIEQEKEEISAIIKTISIEPMVVSDEVIGENNPEHNACEVEQKLGKHEQNERVVPSRKNSVPVTTATEEHNGTERVYMEEGIAAKTVAVHNLAENFQREKEPEEYDGQFVSPLECNENLACFSSSYHLVTVNEGDEKRVNGILECDKDTVNEILEQGIAGMNAEGLDQLINVQVTPKEGGDLCNLTMITPSTPVLLLEDFEKLGCIKPDSSDSNEGNEGIIASTYGTKTINTQDNIASSQRDQSQQQLLEEHEVVKLENSEILNTCLKLVEDRLTIGNILTDDSNHEKASASTTPTGFTIESKQEGDTTTTTAVGLSAEGNQVQDTTDVDQATENQFPLQILSPARESSEETPFLQKMESIIGSSSNSTEQHRRVSMGKPVTDISPMQCEVEADEESEKSPLLSPREPSAEDFRVSNHSARKIKPFQNLLTESRIGMLSPLKEQQSVPINNDLVSSPRSKGKQKNKSSLFINCMCCVTPTN